MVFEGGDAVEDQGGPAVVGEGDVAEGSGAGEERSFMVGNVTKMVLQNADSRWGLFEERGFGLRMEIIKE